jgi:hypothetical protein
MGAKNHGAAMASGPTPVVGMDQASPGSSARSNAASPGRLRRRPEAAAAITPEAGRSRFGSRSRQRWIAAIVLAATALTGGVGVPLRTATADSSYLLMPRAELLALPTSGTAWNALKAVADGSMSTPDLCNQNASHHLETLAAALVYARTGVASYGSKARAAIMAAIQTQQVGCTNAVLALGRQLTAYVLAANLAGLSGSDDSTFRSWLSAIRTKVIGGHPVWNALVVTHLSSPNNWGAYAGAARIAADLYLGDTTDLAAAARVTRGFLGDRAAYAGFTQNLTADAIAWSCTGNVTTYSPENGACAKSGINLDGGVAADISRGGSLRWPPADPGIPYQLEAIQGTGLQVELLYRNGYPDAWNWSNNALERAAAIVSRSAASGGTGWNATTTARQMPWLLNLRYGTSIPTQTSGMGRAIGFTDWLYGSGAAASGGTGGTGGTGGDTTAAPTTTTPVVRLGASSVTAGRVAAGVHWSLSTSSDGLRRYDLQVSVDGGSFSSLALATATTAARSFSLVIGHRYVFRVRAVDRSGRVGTWSVGPQTHGFMVSDASTTVSYRGAWGTASYAGYLGGKVHDTRSSGPTASVRFSGSAVAIVGPKGPGRGRSAVYVDGRYVATIDQAASSFVARRVLLIRNVGAGTHVIMVKALGTAGRPMVALDALEVLATG